MPALKATVDDLVSNWAYMVMASLAWTLKAWAALLLPEEPGHVAEHRSERRSWLRMEFPTFRAAVIDLPCQVVRGGGRLIFRLMSWNPWQGALLRLVERLRMCGLCRHGAAMKSGSGCPDPCGPASEERREAMVERRTGAAPGAETSGQ